jgi:hypothetical protein
VWVFPGAAVLLWADIQGNEADKGVKSATTCSGTCCGCRWPGSSDFSSSWSRWVGPGNWSQGHQDAAKRRAGPSCALGTRGGQELPLRGPSATSGPQPLTRGRLRIPAAPARAGGRPGPWEDPGVGAVRRGGRTAGSHLARAQRTKWDRRAAFHPQREGRRGVALAFSWLRFSGTTPALLQDISWGARAVQGKESHRWPQPPAPCQ